MQPPVTGSEYKVLSADRMYRKRQALKTQGSRVVFTNGCFDLVHRGHISFLQTARSLGDILVVGVNSDASVGRLKGVGRPILQLDDRLLLLAEFSSVDFLCVFAEDTPYTLICNLLPDVLVKGSEYEITDIVGAEEVRKNGGDVVTVPMVDGYSTTSLVERIRSK